ncbi:TetR/AcrR family transcriptional regulator [Jonesia quinghaiensis]|uniref:TetR/AcrR family transcriptional regulator n=1 Tax=Jonesia quinghaiensis TaxID=262806 RepID=UPI000401E402|nr:TetR/AcrR family transcriptional regulator [Jonesia quinghaiensis]
MSRGETTRAQSYESGRKRRSEILEHAFTHFARYGYHGASLREIAAHTGVSHAGLRYHFKTKEDLLLAVLAQREQIGTDLVALDELPEEPSEEQAWELVQRFVSLMKLSFEHPGFIELFITQAVFAADKTHPANGFFSRRYKTMRAEYTQGLHAIKAAGLLKPEISPEAAAVALIGFLEGLQIQWLLEPDDVDYMEVARRFMRALIIEEHLDRIDTYFAL